jgi:hypothetical protein
MMGYTTCLDSALPISTGSSLDCQQMCQTTPLLRANSKNGGNASLSCSGLLRGLPSSELCRPRWVCVMCSCGTN